MHALLALIFLAAPPVEVAVPLDDVPSDRAVAIAPHLSLRRLAPNALVVVHEQPWAANSLLYIAKDGTLILAGSPYTPETTQHLLTWLRTRYGARPLVHIATHFHFDASGAIGAFQAAGGRTLASVRTAELLAARQTGLRDGVMALLKDRPDQLAAFKDLVIPPPKETFPDGQNLRLDFGEPVEIIDPGPGHSEDNVVVWFPESKILFGGCLVRSQAGAGNTTDADLAHWPKAIEGLKSLGAQHIVPGHGDRFGGDLLEFTQTQVKGP